MGSYVLLESLYGYLTFPVVLNATSLKAAIGFKVCMIIGKLYYSFMMTTIDQSITLNNFWLTFDISSVATL